MRSSPLSHCQTMTSTLDWTGRTGPDLRIRDWTRRYWWLMLWNFQLRETRVRQGLWSTRTVKAGRIFSSTICGATGSSEAALVHGRMVYGLIVTAMSVITLRLVLMVAS